MQQNGIHVKNVQVLTTNAHGVFGKIDVCVSSDEMKDNIVFFKFIYVIIFILY